MALGLGEGGEQNAPLGRAVIGGLLVATCRDAVRRARGLCLAPRKLPTKHVMEQSFLAEEREGLDGSAPAGSHA